jgi:large subunit ribosomal protein L15
MLERLKRRAGARQTAKRVGRGMASGHGRTCGRGQKGMGARAGSKKRAYLEGGQIPLARRLPKVGFNSPFRDPPAIVNVKDLARFEKGTVVDRDALVEAGLLRRAARRVKVLAQGEIGVALTVRVDAVSSGARTKLEGAGGTVEIGPTPPRGAENHPKETA